MTIDPQLSPRHATDVETRIRVSDAAGDEHHYRWVCSCGLVGAWKPRAFQARFGATKHAAYYDRAESSGPAGSGKIGWMGLRPGEEP